MNKNILKIAGVINIVFGIICTLTIIGCIIGIPLLVSGVLYVQYSNLPDDRLLSKIDSIKIWMIVLIFINLISAILS